MHSIPTRYTDPEGLCVQLKGLTRFMGETLIGAGVPPASFNPGKGLNPGKASFKPIYKITCFYRSKWMFVFRCKKYNFCFSYSKIITKDVEQWRAFTPPARHQATDSFFLQGSVTVLPIKVPGIGSVASIKVHWLLPSDQEKAMNRCPKVFPGPPMAIPPAPKI